MKTKHLGGGRGYDIRITAGKDVRRIYTADPLVALFTYNSPRLRLQLVRRDKTPGCLTFFT